MIKVKFSSKVYDDICDIVEKSLNSKDIVKWIEAHVPNISFDCMNFPYDMEDCYECYFQSKNDIDVAQKIYKELKKHLAEVNYINVEIWTVNSKLEDIINVGNF